MSPPDWSRWARELFDPQRTLKGEDLALFVARPDRQLERLVRELEEPDGTAKYFLTGTTGAGKSSELAELGRRKWDTWAVIPVDVQASAANVNEISGVEVLLMIGVAAIRAAGWYGIAIGAGRRDALLTAFKRMAREPDRIDTDRLVNGVVTFAVSAGATAAGAPAVGGIATGTGMVGGAVARLVRPFGGLARPVSDADPEVDSLADAVRAVLDDIAVVRRPLVLVDGLDRIERPDVVRSVFVQNRLLELPACPVVYAGPISLWADPDYVAVTGSGRFKNFPVANLPVQLPVPGFTEISAEKVEGARATLLSVVARRLQRERRTVEQVFEDDALAVLIEASGGVLRDLVGLVQEAMRQAAWADPPPGRIGMAQATAAVAEKRQAFEPGLTNQLAVRELETVEATGQPSGTELSARLLLRGAILGYHHTLHYFRVHPLARTVLPHTAS